MKLINSAAWSIQHFQYYQLMSTAQNTTSTTGTIMKMSKKCPVYLRQETSPTAHTRKRTKMSNLISPKLPTADGDATFFEIKIIISFLCKILFFLSSIFFCHKSIRNYILFIQFFRKLYFAFKNELQPTKNLHIIDLGAVCRVFYLYIYCQCARMCLC